MIRSVCFVLLTVVAVTATAHDSADSPHLSCQLDGDTTLICVYNRHHANPANRPGRAGYADKGRYAFTCRAGEDASDHRTSMCRAGTGTGTRFACWTQEARSAWLEQSETNDPTLRERVTAEYVFQGKSVQDTLFKFLVNPESAGRAHFLADDNVTSADIRDYAGACDLDTSGGLQLADLTGLISLWALFDDD